MTLESYFKSLAFIFLGVAPVFFILLIESRLIDKFGESTYEIIFGIAVVLCILGITLHIAFIFWKVFGGSKKNIQYFWGKGKKARIIQKTGRQAIAELVKIGEHSGGMVLTINEQPFVNLEFLVYDGVKSAYKTNINTIVSRINIPMFQPGAKFPVRIDLNDDYNIVFDAERWIKTREKVLKNKNWTDQDREILDTKGLNATVNIIDVQDTGRSEEFLPVISITFDVNTETKNTYRATRDICADVDDIKIIKSSVGKTFDAKVHPNDKEKVLINFTL